jgi:hypothetical protein
MSLSQEQMFDEPLRRYDEGTDRLFLVYYPIVPGFNRNKWGVTETSLHTNIHTAVNKPVVILKKNPDNPIHTRQAGAYIHPTPELAETELGHKPNAEQYYKWQEKFAVGRVCSVDKRDKGYAFTLEITDTDAKNILKSDAYRNGIPGWTSPQILSHNGLYPDEEQSGIFDHWAISHIALLDVPAYGYEQSGVRAKCLGAEKDCKITTRSASLENLGFCVKQATIDLIDSRSSHVESNNKTFHTTMSESENTSPPKTGETLTYTAPADNTPQSKQQTLNEVPTQPVPQTKEESGSEIRAQEEQQQLQSVKTLDEANVQIRQMSELLKEQTKQLKSQQKELDLIKLERKQARLSFIIPRELFKSDESHQKEVQKFMNENISEQWLAEYWNTKKQLAMAQSTAKRIEEPIAVKSASLQQGHDVPDFSSSQNTANGSNVQKQLELQKMILEGGAG